MKKLAGLGFAVLLFAGTVSAAGGRVILTLYGNCLDLAKNKFTQQESRYKAFFEAKAAVAVSGNLYIWASHGYFPLRDSWKDWEKKSSFNPDVRVERTLAKRIIAGGCGVYIGYFEPHQFAIRAEAGICSVHNAIDSTVKDIETTGLIRAEEAKQAGIGARGGLAVTYGLTKRVFSELSAGYLYAAKKIDDVRSNLGGLYLALGLGIKL
jgi:hypothetical protein